MSRDAMVSIVGLCLVVFGCLTVAVFWSFDYHNKSFKKCLEQCVVQCAPYLAAFDERNGCICFDHQK